MGVINVSPESFYKGSVRTDYEGIAELAKEMSREGADIIDVGARSTAPYLNTEIELEEEKRRMKLGLEAVRSSVSLPISADTFRSEVGEEAIKFGATVINDITGLKADVKMAKLIAEYKIGALLLAYESLERKMNPIERVKACLKDSLEIAKKEGIDESKIVLDPGIGFFRKEGIGFRFTLQRDMEWYLWDSIIIMNLEKLYELNRPISVSPSRKSFIGKILNLDKPEDRLFGSIGVEVLAFLKGAHMIRTHDVRAAKEAIKVVERIIEYSKRFNLNHWHFNNAKR